MIRDLRLLLLVAALSILVGAILAGYVLAIRQIVL